ncbi:MAG: hypothetical protein OEY14_11040, partial [Myxococcales bacterium]|nr:hypothetical protein [Myxococcales bacterium]
RGQAEVVLGTRYARDPEHRLQDREAGPQVHAAFARARERRPQPIEVAIENETPSALELRLAPLIIVRLSQGADAVEELRLSYRRAGGGAFEQTLMRFDAQDRTIARARVPLVEGDEAYDLEFFVEALAPSRARIAGVGSRGDALAVHVPAPVVEAASAQLPVPDVSTPERPPQDSGGGGILGQWWFWGAVGIVVAGAVVGGFLMSQSGAEAPDGTLGSGVFQ